MAFCVSEWMHDLKLHYWWSDQTRAFTTKCIDNLNNITLIKVNKTLQNMRPNYQSIFPLLRNKSYIK